jgi:hypothetical protein
MCLAAVLSDTRVFQRREFFTLACLPSAVRVFLGSRFSVCFRFAALVAFLIFFRAAARCFWLAIESPPRYAIYSNVNKPECHFNAVVACPHETKQG